MEVWDEARVAALAQGEASELAGLLVDAGADVAVPGPDSAPSHTGKYRQLSAWLAGQDVDQVRASFSDLEEAIGLPLPPSCRNHVPHWHSYHGSAVARAIIDAGWRARDVNLTAETVRFERQSRSGT